MQVSKYIIVEDGDSRFTNNMYQDVKLKDDIQIIIMARALEIFPEMQNFIEYLPAYIMIKMYPDETFDFDVFYGEDIFLQVGVIDYSIYKTPTKVVIKNEKNDKCIICSEIYSVGGGRFEVEKEYASFNGGRLIRKKTDNKETIKRMMALNSEGRKGM